ncbi:hypothetical protein ACGC1H_006134 [Rhizoctonia solani]
MMGLVIRFRPCFTGEAYIKIHLGHLFVRISPTAVSDMSPPVLSLAAVLLIYLDVQKVLSMIRHDGTYQYAHAQSRNGDIVILHRWILASKSYGLTSRRMTFSECRVCVRLGCQNLGSVRPGGGA